ncbi:MAG: YebC/PmpR family DNA-binding transcriptional regulator [Patescibacteria group bacterium]
MAGHSKWKNNLGRKTAQDAKKSANFGKLSKAITVAVLEGGSPDPNFNPRLRVAVDAARAGSMPKDNIERAIAKASGPDKAALVTTLYEVFGPHGCQMLVTATTDNPNRTNNEIRSVVEKHSGKLGVAGSVKHLFTHCGVCEVGHDEKKVSDDDILTVATELEAMEYEVMEDGHAILFFPFNHVGKSKEKIESLGLKVYDGPNVIYKATMPIEVTDAASQEVISKLVEVLENHDDVQEVFTNIA